MRLFVFYLSQGLVRVCETETMEILIWCEKTYIVTDKRMHMLGIGKILKIKLYKQHTGKSIRRFAGIYAYCRYLIDRKW